MLDKKMLGTSGGAIVHTIWLEHGPQGSPRFFGLPSARREPQDFAALVLDRDR